MDLAPFSALRLAAGSQQRSLGERIASPVASRAVATLQPVVLRSPIPSLAAISWYIPSGGKSDLYVAFPCEDDTLQFTSLRFPQAQFPSEELVSSHSPPGENAITSPVTTQERLLHR
jgi:hypothetical protein